MSIAGETVTMVVWQRHSPGADPGILERGAGKAAKTQTERRRGSGGASPKNLKN